MDKNILTDRVRVEIHPLKGTPRHLVPLIRKAVRYTLEALPGSEEKKLNLPFTYTLHVSLVTPKTSQDLNKKFRRKNKPTDVLSFSILDGLPLNSPAPEIGDILICYAVAKAQAKRFQTSLEDEIQRLTVHGVLHLFGYDHEKNKKDEVRMFKLQEKILSTLL